MLQTIIKVIPIILLASLVSSAEYGVGPLNESDTIYFKSSAKLEFIEGKTQHINGGFNFDPDNVSPEMSGTLRVDLRTLETGIATRDEHMRDNHLHTVNYPYAYFELNKVKDLPVRILFDTTYILEGTGTFYIHGGYREISARLNVTRKKLPFEGDVIAVVAEFRIRLDEFKISRPKALFLKLAETIEVRAAFTGSTLTPIKPVKLPDWPKLE